MIELFANTNPLTAENFRATTHPRHWSRSRLVWRGYYSGKRFWRRMDLRRWVPRRGMHEEARPDPGILSMGNHVGQPNRSQYLLHTKEAPDYDEEPPHVAFGQVVTCEWVWCDQARWADGRKWICSLLCQCQWLSTVIFFPEYVCVDNGRLVRVHFRLCPGNLWEVCWISCELRSWRCGRRR